MIDYEKLPKEPYGELMEKIFVDEAKNRIECHEIKQMAKTSFPVI